MKEIKLIIQLIGVLAWPGVVLYVIISFHTPLKKLLEQLTKKFSEASASRISFGSLSLELENRLQQQGAGILAEAARKLSRGAFDLILRLGDPNHHHGLGSAGPNLYYLPDPKMLAIILELHQAKLLAFTEPVEEFLRFVQTHSLVKHVASSSGQGHVVLSKEGLTDIERKRVEHMNFRLNEEGKRVHDALLEILLTQLSGTEQN